MSHSDIIRISAGAINGVNDAVIGGDPQGASSTVSGVGGQLGKEINLDDSQIIYSGATQIFGGTFRYVRLAAAAGAVVFGQIAFWDISVADSLFQVTDSEAGSTTGAQFRAGIFLNAITPGNYGFIQTWGPTNVIFANPLTGTPAVGAAVYAGAFGAGANLGHADVINAGINPVDQNDAGLLMNRYLGAAIALPVAGAVSLVNLNIMNRRG